MFQFVSDYLLKRLPDILEYASKRNVMVIKLLQSLAGINGMPDKVNTLIRQNTNRVYYTDDEIDYKLLSQITSKYKIILDDHEPMNSGMIAIVFSGVNSKNERVIIKIQRKGIKARIAEGYKSISALHRFMYRILYPFRRFDEILTNIKSFVESKDYILTQCEFKSEIYAMNSIRKTVSEYNQDIVIPICYNDETDNDFIVMEFIEGKSCFDIDESQKQQVCRLMFLFTFITCYLGEVGHSDMHPGNIIVIINGDKIKLGIIDFGMNIVMSENLKNWSILCLNWVVENEDNPGKEVDLLKDSSYLIEPPVPLDKLTSEQYSLLNERVCYLVKSAGDGDLDETKLHLTVKAIREVLNCDNIVLSMDLVKYAMGVSMLQSSGRLLIKDPKETGDAIKYAVRAVMAM
jgi:predicted unusual protein kinase regulating ubiquinone biosynthesis (AarF/ABC1/UbiB family)